MQSLGFRVMGFAWPLDDFCRDDPEARGELGGSLLRDAIAAPLPSPPPVES